MIFLIKLVFIGIIIFTTNYFIRQEITKYKNGINDLKVCKSNINVITLIPLIIFITVIFIYLVITTGGTLDFSLLKTFFYPILTIAIFPRIAWLIKG